MIREALLNQGINEKNLVRFRRLKHEKFFKEIISAENWQDLEKKGELHLSLTKILAEIGLRSKEFLPMNNTNLFNQIGEQNYRLYVGKMMACKMLGTLFKEKYIQGNKSFTLNNLYDDTFGEMKK